MASGLKNRVKRNLLAELCDDDVIGLSDPSDLIDKISPNLRAIKQMEYLLTFTITSCEIILEVKVSVVVALQCVRDKF